jgi:hypothetical protein
MHKDFTLYPEAFELKQLGFDEVCIYHYKKNDEGKHTSHPTFEMLTPFGKNHNILDSRVSAPTYSQSFRWFREKHGLCIVIKPIADKKLDLGYNLLKNGLIMNAHLTYEGAELACLRNLIKIVKEQTNGKK